MVINASRSDLDQICKIHKSSLPGDFLSGLSDRFLMEFFYPVFINNALFLVWKEKGTVKGFLIIVLDVKSVSKILFFNINTAKEILWQLFKKPVFVVKNVLGILFSKTQIQKEFVNSPEIYLIAIDNSCQGQGIGTKLITMGLKYLGELSYRSCIVKTTSEKASLFYLKNNFFLIGRENRYDKKMKILGKIIR